MSSQKSEALPGGSPSFNWSALVAAAAAFGGIAAFMNGLAAQTPPPNKPAAVSPKAVDPGAAKPLKGLSADEARQLYEQHQRQLERVDAEQASLSKEVDAMAFERARLKSELIEKAQQIKSTERKLSATEVEVFELRAKEQLKRIELNERSAEMSKILAVLQRLGRHPPPVMVTERQDALNMVRSGILLAHSFSTIKPLADKLAADLSELETLSDELENRLEKQKRLVAELNARRQEIEPALAAQREEMQTGQARLQVLKVAAVRHNQAVATLGDIVAKLDGEVARQTALGAYEAELKGPAFELKPETKKLAFVQPGRMKPALPFNETKGLLPRPAQGARVRNFGAPDGYGGASKGIAIETRDSAQITSPCDGWVVYADNFRNYGQLLIINAGGGYHILLAGMEGIQVGLGQFVLAGEPVAVMGSHSKADGGSSSKPTLYVEFRKDQRPVDPDPWWSSGVEKG